MEIKNLSQLKRIPVGTQFYLTNYLKGYARTITVTKVSTTMITYTYDGAEQEGHIKFEKAKYMQFSPYQIQFLAYITYSSYDVNKQNPMMSPSPDFQEGQTWLMLEYL